jgi:hypothetical protein
LNISGLRGVSSVETAEDLFFKLATETEAAVEEEADFLFFETT